MREEGKVRAAGCLRLELVGDAAAAVMDVAEAELAAAGAALADLAFVAVQVGRARLAGRRRGRYGRYDLTLLARDAEFFGYDENVTGGFAGVRRR